MFKTIKVSVLSFILASFIIPSISFAQTSGDVDTSGGSSSSCVTIDNNISYKNRKNNNKDDVTNLQDFLNGAGYLNADAVTGFFGKLTEKAVIKFQRDNGLRATPPGFVGAGTRAKINEVSCSGSGTTSVPIEAPNDGSGTGSGRGGYGSLPAGCRSNQGYSPLTGQSCANNSNLPRGCRTSSGFSPVTGQSCAGTGTGMCTEEMRFCPDGSAMPRDPSCGWHPEQCGDVVPPQPNSSVPTVEFIGRPILRIRYDSAGKESVLEGKATIRITAGNDPINIGYDTDNSQVARILQFYKGSGPTSTNSMRFSAVSSRACVPTATDGCLIPSKSSITFNVTNTVKTGQLFAGNYSMIPGNFWYNNIGQQIQVQDFKGISTSNSVTIIGETLPYITQVAQDPMPSANGYYDMYGDRFSPISNNVTINGITKSVSGLSVSTMLFNPADFNLVSGNYYFVQVSTSEGASNNFSFLFTGNTTPTNSSVSAVVTDGPTLTLNYDSNNKEASLTARATVKVTAGDTDLNVINPNLTTFPNNITSYLNLYINSAGTKGYQPASSLSVTVADAAANGFTNNGSYWVIPAHKAVLFTVVGTTNNLKQMFAGSYHAAPLAYNTVNQQGGSNNIILSKDGNYVTIIGETSPYVTGVYSDPRAEKTNGYVIYGSRFNAYSNQVTINGITKTLGTDAYWGLASTSSIHFIPSDFNLVSGSYYVAQVSTSEGASNNVNFLFTRNTVQSVPPTIEFIGIPVLKLEYDSQGKEAQLIGRVAVKITTGDLPVDIRGLDSVLRLMNNGGYTRDTNNTRYTITPNSTTIIPAKYTAVFGVSVTVPAKELVPGSYTASPSQMSLNNQGYVAQSNPVIIMGEVSKNVLNQQVSNPPLTVIGENAYALNSVVTVISPNGGEVWQKGSTQNVQYGITNNPVNHMVMFKLFKNGTFVQDIVSTGGEKWVLTGQYGSTGGGMPWLVPTSLSEGSYSVQAIDYTYDGNTIISQDYSDNYFTITPATVTPSSASISVSSPTCTIDAGTNGCYASVTWNTTNVANPRVSAYSTALGFENPMSSSPSYTGYNYRVLNGSTTFNLKDGSTLLNSVGFVASCASGSTWSGSNCVLNTTTPTPVVTPTSASIAVTYPNGGEFLNNGQTIAVKWNASPNIESVTIAYVNETTALNPNGGFTGLIANSIPNTGSYNLKLMAPLPLDTKLKIRIFANYKVNASGYQSVIDDSDSFFIVSPQGMPVSLLIPSLQAPNPTVLGDFISNATCTSLPINMHRGAESSSVTNLQNFLIQKGMLTETASGFYGDKTVEAVKDYQASKGLPTTGMVYDFTRQAIEAESCR